MSIITKKKQKKTRYDSNEQQQLKTARKPTLKIPFKLGLAGEQGFIYSVQLENSTTFSSSERKHTKKNTARSYGYVFKSSNVKLKRRCFSLHEFTTLFSGSSMKKRSYLREKKSLRRGDLEV